MKKIVSIILALLMISCLSVSVFAAQSPVAPIKDTFPGGTATYEYDTNTGNITLTVSTKDGYKFLGWEIDGDYDIISGTLKSETLVIKFTDNTQFEDIESVAYPKFKKLANNDNTKPTTKPSDEEPVSPGTSDNGLGLVVLAALALGGVVVSRKKLSK